MASDIVSLFAEYGYKFEENIDTSAEWLDIIAHATDIAHDAQCAQYLAEVRGILGSSMQILVMHASLGDDE